MNNRQSPVAWVYKARLGKAKSLIVGLLNEAPYKAERYVRDTEDRGVAAEIAILVFAVGAYLYLKLYT